MAKAVWRLGAVELKNTSPEKMADDAAALLAAYKTAQKSGMQPDELLNPFTRIIFEVVDKNQSVDNALAMQGGFGADVCNKMKEAAAKTLEERGTPKTIEDFQAVMYQAMRLVDKKDETLSRKLLNGINELMEKELTTGAGGPS